MGMSSFNFICFHVVLISYHVMKTLDCHARELPSSSCREPPRQRGHGDSYTLEGIVEEIFRVSWR